jgi:hypothetical protein
MMPTGMTGPIGPTGAASAAATGPTGSAPTTTTNDNTATSARLAPAHNPAMAKRCLAGLDPNAERFAFQFRKSGCEPFDAVYASFEELWSTVLAWNTPAEGVEVFVKAADSIGRPLALFAVANGYEQIDAAAATMQVCDAKADMLLQNGGQLWICFACNNIPSDHFPTLQKCLSEKLGTDLAVSDLLPLPGTLNLANPKAPQLMECNGAGERWNFDDLANKLGLPATGNGADPNPATNRDASGGANGPLTVSAGPAGMAEAANSVAEPVPPADFSTIAALAAEPTGRTSPRRQRLPCGRAARTASAPQTGRRTELCRTGLGYFPRATRKKEKLQGREVQQRREVGQDARPRANPARLPTLVRRQHRHSHGQRQRVLGARN